VTSETAGYYETTRNEGVQFRGRLVNRWGNPAHGTITHKKKEVMKLKIQLGHLRDIEGEALSRKSRTINVTFRLGRGLNSMGKWGESVCTVSSLLRLIYL